MKIDISIHAPEMPEKVCDDYKHKDLKEKIDDYMFVCESDEDSEYHWNYLKHVYNRLHSQKNLPKQYHPLMKKLEDFMSKYGREASDDKMPELTGENMFKYRDSAE